MSDVETPERLDRFWALLERVPVSPDAEPLYDAGTESGRLRRSNLERYFELVAGTRLLLVGEAPGWRGMTITGVPFLDVRLLGSRPGPVSGRAEGDWFRMPEHPAAPWEASARDVQRVLAAIPAPKPASWPVFPHHPFVTGDARTNRTPRPAEVAAGLPVALEVARMLGDPLLVAVGRKAQGALAAAGLEVPAVRHPAQGGARLFAEQIGPLLG